MSKTCIKCHKTNPDEAMFCEKCGTRLEIVCPSCGEISVGNKYCTQCGKCLIESRFSKVVRTIQEIYRQSFNRQCTCGEINKSHTKYCIKCGKRLGMTKFQKYKVLMIVIIVLACLSLIPIIYSTVCWMARSTVIDVEGNVYRTVRIGNQLWMNENLRTTHYADGTPIAIDSFTSTWDPYIYYPDGDSNKAVDEGCLYNYPAACGRFPNLTNFKHGICPYGWHVPSEKDLKQLRESGKSLKPRSGDKYRELYWGISVLYNNEGEIEHINPYDEHYYEHYYLDNTMSEGHYVRCVRDEKIK